MFNSVMTTLVKKTVDEELPKDTVTMNELLNIAVKYFSISRVTKEGDYVGRVCVGLNDIKSTEDVRKPYLEAFAFSSIMKHYQSDEYSLRIEFTNAMKELYAVNLGIDLEERFLRAQGAMFFLMRNNNVLKEVLISEYEKQKKYFPFVLTEL
ncbi:MAG TPA: hypothetical protein VKX31_05815 [Brumimicrobium sp.]|nr:hypothetical protein [Brumimicrobium sp.]